MRHKLRRAIKSSALSLRHRLPEVLGVPVYNDGGLQVQPGHAVVLTFDGPITDFTLTTDAQGVFEGVMGLALVEADLNAALHVGIKKPIADEERALNATDFTQGKCKLVLTWIADWISSARSMRGAYRRNR